MWCGAGRPWPWQRGASPPRLAQRFREVPAAQRSCSQHKDVDQLHAWRHREPHGGWGADRPTEEGTSGEGVTQGRGTWMYAGSRGSAGGQGGAGGQDALLGVVAEMGRGGRRHIGGGKR